MIYYFSLFDSELSGATETTRKKKVEKKTESLVLHY